MKRIEFCIIKYYNRSNRKMGGNVFFDRVGGVLAVSRAFGDHALRSLGVICTPNVIRTELRLTHRWLVIASDGLWDTMTDKVT
jgi:serine/threonine protein phosphatase PrpC